MLKSVLKDIQYLSERSSNFGDTPTAYLIQSTNGDIHVNYEERGLKQSSHATQQGIIIFIIPPAIRKTYLKKCFNYVMGDVNYASNSIQNLHITCGGEYGMHITCIFKNGMEARYGANKGYSVKLENFHGTGFDNDTLVCFLKNIYSDINFNEEANLVCKMNRSRNKNVYARLINVYPTGIQDANEGRAVIDGYKAPLEGVLTREQKKQLERAKEALERQQKEEREKEKKRQERYEASRQASELRKKQKEKKLEELLKIYPNTPPRRLNRQSKKFKNFLEKNPDIKDLYYTKFNPSFKWVNDNKSLKGMTKVPKYTPNLLNISSSAQNTPENKEVNKRIIMSEPPAFSNELNIVPKERVVRKILFV
jgi:hypothetical protein